MEKITVVLKPTRENIKRVANAMEHGAIVIYPTESSYGIGCDFTNQEATEELMKIKNRKKNKHLIAIVPNLEMAKKYGKINDIAEKLIERFMPGPLTLSVPGKGKLKEFNFRISENSIARLLSRELKKPIISTSANLSGKDPMYNSKELEQFFGKVDAILDDGNIQHREPSTVVVINENKIRVAREGAITKQKIKNFIKR